MKKIWITGGLLIIGFMSIGFVLDKWLAKDHWFTIIGFGLGLIILAFMVFNGNRKS